MHSFLRKKLLILLFFAFSTVIINAKEEIHFGVFAYLGYKETREKYQPLVEYLNHTLDQKVILEVLTQEELNNKIASGKLDIVITNPTHFLVIRQKYALSGAIATLIGYSEGTPTSKLGGVILVRQNSPIQTLNDIAGKTIATPSKKHMGGFRAQAYELYLHDVHLSENKTKIIETLGSHQEVVHDILNNKADVGFIRDGVLEGMIQKGEINAGDVRIINEQYGTTHPFKVSTKLYPEWPIFALPNADEKDVKSFLTALLSLQPNHEEIKRGGIYGFALPADYLEVEQLARDMRLPPFDRAPTFTLDDIVEKHSDVILIASISFFLILLYYIREQRRKKLFESLLNGMGDGVYGVDKDGLCIWINTQALNMLGYTEKEVLYKDQHILFHHHKPSHALYDVTECPIYLTLQDYQTRQGEDYFIRRDGTFFPVSLTVAPTSRYGAIIIFRDITDQMRMNQDLQETRSKLEEANSALTLKNHQLNELAMLDGLTHIANRRLFDEVYDKKYKETLRDQKSLAILMIDVDYFKYYNDHYGHAKGDECLISIAQTLKNTLKRPTDFVARYGGEEFVVILKDIHLNGAIAVGYSLVDAVANLQIEHAYSAAAPHVSISIGLAFKEHGDTISKENLLNCADNALYRAKEEGRNKLNSCMCAKEA